MRIRESWNNYRARVAVEKAAKPYFDEWDKAVRRKTNEQKRDELLKSAEPWGGLLAIVTRFAGYSDYEEKVNKAAEGIASALKDADKIYVQNIETASIWATPAEREHIDIADTLVNDYGKDATHWGYFEPTYFDTFTYHPSLDKVPEDYKEILEDFDGMYAPPEGSNLEVIINAARETSTLTAEQNIGLKVGYVAIPSALRLYIDGIEAPKDDIRGGSVHVLSEVDLGNKQIKWERVVESDWRFGV